MWRAGFGIGFGPVVRQTAKWMNFPAIFVGIISESDADGFTPNT